MFFYGICACIRGILFLYKGRDIAVTRMRIFWSVYCILLGLLLLLKLLFKWDFSTWSAAAALLCLTSGIFLLTGGFGLRKTRHAAGGGLWLFFNGRLSLDRDDAPLKLVFSTADIQYHPPMDRIARVYCLFSDALLHIPQGCSVRTVCSTALGDIVTPHGRISGHADRIFIIGDGLQTQMEVRAVFSHITILD